MLFPHPILCWALAGGGAAAAAFAPAPGHRPPIRMGGGDELAPADLIASGWTRKSAFARTETLRWERQSTLSPDETSAETAEAVADFPTRLANGIYDMQNEAQHSAWLQANSEKIMVIKFYAPWCRACKSVEPKFVIISKDDKYAGVPIVFGQFSVQHNKDFVKSLGIIALPSIQIYAGAKGGLVENFPCGPSKIPLLRRKLTETINAKVDPATMALREDLSPVDGAKVLDEVQSAKIPAVVTDTRKEENLVYLRTGVPYFKDFSDTEFYDLMDKANLVTFEQGDIIMRQGMEGSVFYVIESGEVEVFVKTAFEDPLTTPPGYLGAGINLLGPHNYFGERALITHEPRAASIRALQKTRCFAFDVADIPSSSVLSGNRAATNERLEEVNLKYGTDVYDIDMISDQLTTASVANQQRGSINRPDLIRGVDVDEDYVSQEEDAALLPQLDSNDRVISLLVRFRQIQRAAKCFNYILKSRPNFGDAGESRRRALLMSKLTRSQREDFLEMFRLIDTGGNGKISILELRRAMETAGEGDRSDEELKEMINNSNPDIDGNEVITQTEFMGVMAEAEFYYLFLDTFEMLDVNKTGYVAAGDLDRVLCGVRDLISDDRMSIIDTKDMDMQIDYETYADMLLGKPL